MSVSTQATQTVRDPQEAAPVRRATLVPWICLPLTGDNRVMQLIERAGTYTPAPGGEPNDWIVHLENDDLSVGTYSIPAGGVDDQEPHTEDEIYVVRSGRGTLVTDTGTVPVEPGSVVFVPAGETHRFTDITEDLALIVVFAPRYGSRALPTIPNGPW
jgi:mannose-6-phosphate isomerase-like protein (cupin superfamily)